MKFCLKVVLLLFVVSGTLTDEGFDLFDALDPDPTSAPKEPPKAPEQPKAPEKPKTDGGFGFDLGDAVEPDAPPTKKPKKPSSGDFDGFDLGDALKPGNDPKPDKPAVNPPKHGGGGGGGGGVFDDSDLASVGDGGYEPDGGRRPNSGNSGYDNRGGADHSQEAGSGPIAGIVSAIGVALMGAASSYIAYQKKKLCFKVQGGVDPESGKGHQGTHSDPQVLSNLLRTN